MQIVLDIIYVFFLNLKQFTGYSKGSLKFIFIEIPSKRNFPFLSHPPCLALQGIIKSSAQWESNLLLLIRLEGPYHAPPHIPTRA